MHVKKRLLVNIETSLSLCWTKSFQLLWTSTLSIGIWKKRKETKQSAMRLICCSTRRRWSDKQEFSVVCLWNFYRLKNGSFTKKKLGLSHWLKFRGESWGLTASTLWIGLTKYKLYWAITASLCSWKSWVSQKKLRLTWTVSFTRQSTPCTKLWATASQCSMAVAKPTIRLLLKRKECWLPCLSW